MLQTSWGFATLPIVMKEYEPKKPIPLGYIDLPLGKQPIMPMDDVFINDMFTKEKNWEIAKIISNIMYEYYIAKNPNTTLTLIEGKIDKVTTQFEHYRSKGAIPKRQDVNILSVSKLDEKEEKQNGNSAKPSHSDLNHSYCRL